MSDLTAVTAERDNYRALWERDSTALGVALGRLSTARAITEDQRARIVGLEREISELAEAGTGYSQATVDAITAERDRLRQALRIIAGEQQCADNLMSNADVARAALGDQP